MAKLLLLDCDGTIREPLSGAKFISHPRDQKIIPGADKAISHYYSKGWSIVGITNQGGVAAGFKSLEDAIAEQEYTLELFPEIGFIYFCPDFEGNHCWEVSKTSFASFPADFAGKEFIGKFRKPNPGMLEVAIMMARALKPECLYVGDRPEDEQAATAAGIRFQWADMWRTHR